MHLSPATDIVNSQATLIEWAKAYEEGEPAVEDFEYDALVRYLQRLKAKHVQEWEEHSFPEFEDGSWAYTGLFYQ